MHIEQFGQSDAWNMHTLKSWWQTHNGVPLPETLLSNYGYMAFEDRFAIACMFFYPVAGCKMAMLGYPIANPDATKEQRKQAIERLVASIEHSAKSLNYQAITSYPGNAKAANIFERLGYTKGDKEVVQYMKGL
jgi:hypothetical protein